MKLFYYALEIGGTNINPIRVSNGRGLLSSSEVMTCFSFFFFLFIYYLELHFEAQADLDLYLPERTYEELDHESLALIQQFLSSPSERLRIFSSATSFSSKIKEFSILANFLSTGNSKDTTSIKPCLGPIKYCSGRTVLMKQSSLFQPIINNVVLGGMTKILVIIELIELLMLSGS